MSSSVPIDTNATAAGRENNRRVEFVVHFNIVNKGGKLMKVVTRFAPLLLPSLLLACGQQLVEFADDGSTDAANLDGEGPDGMAADGPGSDVGTDQNTSDATSSDADDAGNTDATTFDSGTVDGTASDSASMDSGSSDTGLADSANLDAEASGMDAAETAAPIVVSTEPANAAMNVSISKILTATFSEAMDPLTINGTTFTLLQGATGDAAATTPVPGAVTYVSAQKVGQFVPSGVLAVDTLYTATITTGAKSAGDIPLANNYNWSFTTSVCGQAPVVLGAASTFGVLASSAVTNAGPTSVTGGRGREPRNRRDGLSAGHRLGRRDPRW